MAQQKNKPKMTPTPSYMHFSIVMIVVMLLALGISVGCLLFMAVETWDNQIIHQPSDTNGTDSLPVANTTINTNSSRQAGPVDTDANTIPGNNGAVFERVCHKDADCVLINASNSLKECCSPPTCSEYHKEAYVGVSRESLREQLTKVSDALKCDTVQCPLFPPPNCDLSLNKNYKAKCIDLVCRKYYSPQTN